MLNADAFLKENNDRPFAKELAESYVGITEKDIKEIDMLLEKNKYIIE